MFSLPSWCACPTRTLNSTHPNVNTLSPTLPNEACQLNAQLMALQFNPLLHLKGAPLFRVWNLITLPIGSKSLSLFSECLLSTISFVPHAPLQRGLLMSYLGCQKVPFPSDPANQLLVTLLPEPFWYAMQILSCPSTLKIPRDSWFSITIFCIRGVKNPFKDHEWYGPSPRRNVKITKLPCSFMGFMDLLKMITHP